MSDPLNDNFDLTQPRLRQGALFVTTEQGALSRYGSNGARVLGIGLKDRGKPLPRWLSATWLTGVPLVAALAAFQVSARTHMLDDVLASATCGNLSMRASAPEFLGHCAACWSAAVSTGLGTLVVMLMLMEAVTLMPAADNRPT
jgi:hypothetical protein